MTDNSKQDAENIVNIMDSTNIISNGLKRIPIDYRFVALIRLLKDCIEAMEKGKTFHR